MCDDNTLSLGRTIRDASFALKLKETPKPKLHLLAIGAVSWLYGRGANQRRSGLQVMAHVPQRALLESGFNYPTPFAPR